MKWPSLGAILSVASKEFLHIYRDRRVLVLLVILPPLFTVIFGHAFEANEMTGVPALLVNRDVTPRTQRFIDIVAKNKTFQWRKQPPEIADESDLLKHHVWAALVIPNGWSDTLTNGDPHPVILYLDGSDTNTATQLQGSVQQSLADFQVKERDAFADAYSGADFQPVIREAKNGGLVLPQCLLKAADGSQAKKRYASYFALISLVRNRMNHAAASRRYFACNPFKYFV